MIFDQGVRSVFFILEFFIEDFYIMYLFNISVILQKDVKYYFFFLFIVDNEILEDEGVDFVNKDDKFDYELLYKIINSWIEVYIIGNVVCLCLIDIYIWYVDRSLNFWYCSLNSLGFKWQKVNGYVKMVVVFRFGSIVWRLYKDIVYAGIKIVVKYLEGMKWIEVVREV